MDDRAIQLEKRTSKFGESAIQFCKSVKPNLINNPLINQFVKSSTSIGANYIEANSGSSKKDFANKVCIAKKEAEESKHWLKMFLKSEPNKMQEIKVSYRECQELTLIFGKILNTIRNSKIDQ
jgi:four helix bundle protein